MSLPDRAGRNKHDFAGFWLRYRQVFDVRSYAMIMDGRFRLSLV
jgi:hypothetical protein